MRFTITSQGADRPLELDISGYHLEGSGMEANGWFAPLVRLFPQISIRMIDYLVYYSEYILVKLGF